jgi:hypothetical protein
VKKAKPRLRDGKEIDTMYDIADGIIAHLTKQCSGNVHDRNVIEVTSSKPLDDPPWFPDGTVDPSLVAAKNAADLETDSCFRSACRDKKEDIPHTRNNWLCYDFRERRIVPTHYTIRSNWHGPSSSHLKSWLIETSADGKSWREVAHEEDNEQLNGSMFTGTFAVAGGGECPFIRLVTIGRTH